MTILVTGGTGFIGSNFVLDWLAQCDELVVNLDKLTYAGNLQGDPPRLFVQGGLGHRTLVDTLLDQHRPRAVLHFAVESHEDRSIHDPEDFIQTNIVSTDNVYGTLSKNAPPFAETNPYEPNSSYSASKTASDHLVHDWLYVKDHRSVIRSVLEGGRQGETYNIGGWNEKPNIEIVHTVCALPNELHPKTDGSCYTSQITHVPDRPGHDRHYAIDARKIKRELGWKPAKTFKTGTHKTGQWYLSHIEWVQHVQSRSYRECVNKQYGEEVAT